MTTQESEYVFRHYAYLMTLPENAAFKNFILNAKNEANKSRNPDRGESQFYRKKYVNNPEVLTLMEDGFEVFQERVVNRILEEHSDKIYFNLCPKCNQLVRTPKTKQCQHCFHSWHNE